MLQSNTVERLMKVIICRGTIADRYLLYERNKDVSSLRIQRDFAK